MMDKIFEFYAITFSSYQRSIRLNVWRSVILIRLVERIRLEEFVGYKSKEVILLATQFSIIVAKRIMTRMLVKIFAVMAVFLLIDGLPTSDFRSLIKPNTPENSKRSRFGGRLGFGGSAKKKIAIIYLRVVLESMVGRVFVSSTQKPT